MNKKKKREIKLIANQLEILIASLRAICEEETDTLNNWPENLQNSDRYYESEDFLEELEGILDDLQETCENIHKMA